LPPFNSKKLIIAAGLNQSQSAVAGWDHFGLCNFRARDEARSKPRFKPRLLFVILAQAGSRGGFETRPYNF
jgi:hypothetical protein